MDSRDSRQSTKTKQTPVRTSRILQSNPSFTLPTSVTTHNAPLHAHFQRIPVVVASVAEAEYAAAFGGGKVLVELTLTLTNLGHPNSHSLSCLSTMIGLATSSVRPKKSKSIDMRLDWLKERASQQFFRLVFPPGLIAPCQLLYQNPSRLPTPRFPTLPSWNPTPYLFCTAPPPSHTPSSPLLQSSRCSLRQGLPYHSLPFTSTHFFYLHCLVCFHASRLTRLCYSLVLSSSLSCQRSRYRSPMVPS